jgi:hypothetical protein
MPSQISTLVPVNHGMPECPLKPSRTKCRAYIDVPPGIKGDLSKTADSNTGRAVFKEKRIYPLTTECFRDHGALSSV